ncbi:unnamed protein product [Rhizoctonia solani]|uniref:Uncharacterized protein n=1 Tax=Rhizoctonia solani TaxID=456999 RepID=A0A8H3A557_9AGAM|nr:unnamed protein product [Rhizoctonia solani]CAE6530172.1 unnamed protein product [Rhizoctonia solani]
MIPPEIILDILMYVVADIKSTERPKLNGLLCTNRMTYSLLSEKLYCTSILHTPRMPGRFAEALALSPRLASLTRNVWIGTMQLEVFGSSQLGSTSSSISRILALAPNLRHLALPSEYFPRHIAPNGIYSLEHLTITQDLFPLSTPHIPTLSTIHIHGLLWPTRTETLISHCPNLKHVFCTIPFSFPISFVMPAAQCTQALQTRIRSLSSVEFSCSKRVAISLRKALAIYGVPESKTEIIVNSMNIDHKTPGGTWFQECAQVSDD